MKNIHFFHMALSVALFTGLSSVGPLATAQEYIQYGSPNTYNSTSARAAFPQTWGQYGNGQRHNPVFTVPSNAPSFLTTGITTVSPLTGDEFRRVRATPSDERRKALQHNLIREMG